MIPRRAPALLLGAALLATGGCESFDDAVASEGYVDCGAVGASCHPGGAAGAFCAYDP